MAKRGDNIHKRTDGRWEGRYKKGINSNGSIKYGSVYGKSYREVKDKLSTAICIPYEDENHLKNEITFGEILHLWMENNRIRLKGGTINKYQQIIDTQIIKELGNVKISEINSVIINTFLNNKLSHGRRDGKGALSPSYVRSIMLVINAAINYAVQEQYCSPLKSPILKPKEEKCELIILSLKDQQKLETFMFENLTPTNAGVYISLYTGLRIGEICALRWNDINFENKVLRIRHTIARVKSIDENAEYQTQLIIDTPKTASSNRDIPIPSVLLPVLQTIHTTSSSEFVVSDGVGFVSPRTFEYRYHRLLKECGIKSINYHALRHTFATRCIESGVDVKSLSEILGHSNVGITLNTYVHSSMDLKRKQLEKMCSFA